MSNASPTKGAPSSVALGALSNEEFTNLLNQEFKPKSQKAKEAVEVAVLTLAEKLISEAITISDDSMKTIETLIAEIDRKLSEQINEILHHEEFRKVEGTWRGFHYLVNNTETDEMLKIRVLNISKSDFHKTLKKFKGTNWDQSPIFKKIYEEEYGQFGGEPYGCLVADYYFDHTPVDVEILRETAKICAASHTPFISGASPTLMQMGSWQELSNPRDLTKLFTTPEYASWRSLRGDDDSRYVGLAMPRFLARLPYGAKSNPVEEFAFEEDTAGSDHNKFVWANSALPWVETSIVPLNCTVGVHAFAESSRVAPLRTYLFIVSRPMMEVSISSAQPRFRSVIVEKPNWPRMVSCRWSSERTAISQPSSEPSRSTSLSSLMMQMRPQMLN